MMINRRGFLRGLIAMPAVVAVGNIMPVRSIERLITPRLPSRTLFVHPRMFDDLLEYSKYYNNRLVTPASVLTVVGVSGQLNAGDVVTGVGMLGDLREHCDALGDLRVVIRDGVLGIDWPKEDVRIERVELLDAVASEKYADAAHTTMFGDYVDIAKVRKAHMSLRNNGELGEYTSVRLVE